MTRKQMRSQEKHVTIRPNPESAAFAAARNLSRAVSPEPRHTPRQSTCDDVRMGGQDQDFVHESGVFGKSQGRNRVKDGMGNASTFGYPDFFEKHAYPAFERFWKVGNRVLTALNTLTLNVGKPKERHHLFIRNLYDDGNGIQRCCSSRGQRRWHGGD